VIDAVQHATGGASSLLLSISNFPPFFDSLATDSLDPISHWHEL
jgi:hypothetical protein